MPQIVAHRGASADAPENTLAAFRLAWTQHADAIEGDFRLTRDGHIVCIHDGTLRRTAGVDRRVDQLNAAEVRQLDVGRWNSASFAGERVPTLDEVRSLVPSGRSLFLEWKDGVDRVEPLLDRLRADAAARAAVRVICFDADVIAAVKRELPDVAAYWLVGFDARDRGHWLTAGAIVTTLDRIAADGVSVEARPEAIDPTLIDRLRTAGRSLHTWTVDDRSLARSMISLGVASLTTNRPAELRRALVPSPSNLGEG